MLTSFLDMAAQDQFLILDTETTGLHDGEICQIAILSSMGEVLLNSYVRPVRRIPYSATQIHGITDQMVADAPTWAEILSNVQQILEGTDLVVFNAVFDRKMMHKSAEALGLDAIEWKTIARWWCAMNAYAEYWGERSSYGGSGSYRWQSLAKACLQQKIKISDAHSALGDCKLTLALIRAMLQGSTKT